ncbi:hypothetical protein SMACR_00476 [Sordaria macrospora]|uniref:WGS project CABT00000000 data, contig 2.1 n=2 Tax=Sordaria macrospora TaxID=5147 RepID=F7VL82_SORMK|nr:uncharacterized protein SMAC_00476 [Sordaria macrospora k-hell]KAA8635380.1 hypothetical protein SMACR_00476 [Sordaria macrospora]WPJ59227.1 hypothetical protein SMAC4_00476 [Sordaria macrospora]CCC06259.1 unnamed protein product [Sordaria macrospora k-hell]
MERPTRPELLVKTQRYGRCDYEKFDDSISSIVRAGQGSIGKVKVDCRFLLTKSQWGYMGSNPGLRKCPAGIIYLDLDIDQPRDCRLESATFTVTLEEEYDDTDVVSPNLPIFPVTMTDYYGPKQIRGVERTRQIRRKKQVIPEVNILGHGMGGLGVETERKMDEAGRWAFSGHLDSSNGGHIYNRLVWRLDENSLEQQSLHKPTIHTAFALQHNAKGFTMTVDVSGRLDAWTDRFKTKVKRKFGGSKAKARDTASINFQWSQGYTSSSWLDENARSLPHAMEYENMLSIPIEMPDALPANFGPPQRFNTANIPHHNSHYETTHNVQRPPGGQTTWAMPGLHAETQPGLLESGGPLQHLPPLTLEDMAFAAGFSPSPAPPVASRQSERSPRSPVSSDVTMVEECRESEGIIHNTATEDEDDENEEDEAVDEDVVVRPREAYREARGRNGAEAQKRMRLQKGACEKEQVEEKVEEDEAEGERIDVGLLLLLYWLRSTGMTILELLFAVFTFPPVPATPPIVKSVREVEGRRNRIRQEGHKTQRLRRTPKPIAPRKEKVPWEVRSGEETLVCLGSTNELKREQKERVRQKMK